MTLEGLYTILLATDYPVAYSHFNKPQEPPFIVYLFTDDDNLMADDNVYLDIENVDIELYTANKDLVAEQKLQQILKLNNLPYEKSEVFLRDENLYKIIYEVSL